MYDLFFRQTGLISSGLFFSVLFFAPQLNAQLNTSLLGQHNYGFEVNDIWGYVDGGGNEYALVGTYFGCSVVDVTNPAAPNPVYFIPGNYSVWRDVKTWGTYAYFVDEQAGDGLIIVDLSGLPGGAVSHTYWTGGGFSTAHNIFIDEFGFGYLMGANIGGTVFIDIASNPTNPPIVGTYSVYVHDGFAKNNIFYSAEINNSRFRILDVTNKAAPVVLGQQNTGANFTHACWLSNDDNYLFTTDEVGGAFTESYDISNPASISFLDGIQPVNGSPGTNVIPHNVFVDANDCIYVSHYTAGVRVYDGFYPQILIETAYYDTSPFSGGGFGGCWGVYPYLPSGNILATDTDEHSLFIIQHTCTNAAYIEGTVTDAATGAPLNNANIDFAGLTTEDTNSDLIGFYNSGTPNGGSYTITVTVPGYYPVNVVVNLVNGQVIIEDFELYPIGVCDYQNTPPNIDFVDDNSVNISWATDPNDNSYDIRYRPVGSTTWIYVSGVTGNSTTITGLNPNTQYEIEIISNCGNIQSTYSNTDTFTTTSGCTAGFANAGADVAICQGGSANLVASGGASYSWSPTTGLSNASIANPSASPGSTTVYTVTVTDGSGCQDTDQITVTVNNLPTANAGADVSFCSGGSTNLSATGGSNYSWSPATGLSNASIANPTANPVSTTVYTVTVTDANGCTDTDQVTVTVNTPPTANAGADAPICAGGSVNLSATGGVSYSWSPTAGLSNASIANPMANPSSTTVYTVTVTDANGCTDTDQVTVTVNTPPTANAGADAPICQGGSVNLSATGGTSYSWSPTSGLSNASIANPMANPSSTTVYTVTVTDANGCTDTDQVTITVNTPPTANAGADAPICQGGSVNLSATGGTSYSWSPNTGLSNAGIANPMANPTSTTVYTVTVTDANGCTDSDQVTITVNALPTANAGADITLCSGSSAQLAATGGTSYSWSPGTGLSNPNIANPMASPGTTTVYTVTATDANGCTDTDQVTVNVSGSMTTTISPDATICEGDLINLTATGGNSYSWSPTNGLSNPNIGNPTASPTSTTLYTVSITGANGCTATEQVNITVNGLPVADAGNDGSICSGDAVNLNASGGTTYSWSPAIGLSNAGISNPSANPLATTTYTVTVTDGNGCSDTDQVTVTVNPLPTADAGADVTLCSGSSTQLNATGGVNYSWFPTTGLSNANVSNPDASPTTTTNYTVTITDTNGCTDTDQVTVTVSGSLNTTVSSDATICSGDELNLTATGGSSYSWFPSTGLSSPTSGSTLASPSSTTTYTVTITGANGCTATEQVTITVDALPTAIASGSTSICTGDEAQLNATGGSIYNWSPAIGLSNAGIANPMASPAAITVYTVTVTDANGCSATDQLTVTVNDLPAADAGADVSICLGEDVSLQASGGVSYQWSPSVGLNNVTIASPLASPTVNTSYSVTVTDANGCSSTDIVEVTVHSVSINQVNSIDVTGCGTNDASIEIQATGSNLQYSIDGGASFTSGSSFNNLSVGVYNIVVQDINGCLAYHSEALVFAEPTSLSIDGVSITAPECAGDASGSINIVASGGAGTYQFSIDNGTSFQSGSTFENLEDGSYLIQVLDGGGCSVAHPEVVEIKAPNAISVGSVESTNLSCPDSNDGSISISASGGNGSLQYSINGGDFTSSSVFNNLEEGTYSITIRDENNCLFEYSIPQVINTPAPIAVEWSFKDVSSCQNENGQIVFDETTGGTPPYQFSIDGGSSYQNSSVYTSLAAGNYNLAVRDANGCEFSSLGAATIEAPQLPVISDVQVSDVLCFGGSNGFIEIDASSLNGALEYSIDGGESWSATSLFNQLSTGSYSVLIRDGAGCEVSYNEQLSIAAPEKIEINSLTSENISSCGLADGYITIEASGGSGQLSFSIDGGENFFDNGEFAGLGAASYQIIIRDANGCTITHENAIQITEPTAAEITDVQVQNTTSCDEANGTIFIASDQGDVEYSIDNGASWQTVGTFENLGAGEYFISIKDGSDCVLSYHLNPITILSPGAIIIEDVEFTQRICAGTASGSISILVDNPSGQEQFSIDGGASWQETSFFNNLEAGEFNVLVNNPNTGCTSAYPVIILEETLAIDFTDLTVSDVSECGSADGRINIQASGGYGALSYSIDGGNSFSNEAIFSGLSSGTYSVIIRDEMGCSYELNDSYTVSEPVFELDISASTEFLCLGESATITVNNATQVLWSGSSEVEGQEGSSVVVSPVENTTYIIEAFNAHGCMATSSITIFIDEGMAPQPSFNVLVTEICAGEAVQFLNTSENVSGYFWSFEGGEPSVSNVMEPVVHYDEPGVYSVSLLAQGCSEEVELIREAFITVSETPDVAGFEATYSICMGESLMISNTNITALESDSGERWEPVDGQFVFAPTESRSYSLTALNGSCALSLGFEVTVSNAPEIELTGSLEVCKGDEVQLSVGGADGFEWFNAAGETLSIENILTFEADESLNLRIQGNNAEGCISVLEVQLIVEECQEIEFEVPNVITPNGDGTNDTWPVYLRGSAEDVSVRIFNRWGQVVFEDSNYKNNWNGETNKGRLPEGTYFYIIEYKQSRSFKEGTLSILR